MKNVWLLALALIFVVGCGERSSVADPLIVPAREIEGGGSSIEGIGPRGIAVDHTPGEPFAVGFLVKNRSARPVTIKRIAGTDPGRRLVRLIGVSLAPYTERRCTGICPPPPGILGGAPYGNSPSLTPLTLEPGTMAGVTLNFRGVVCSAAPHSVKEIDNRVLRVDYESNGRTGTQLLRTGGARMLVVSNACPAS